MDFKKKKIITLATTSMLPVLSIYFSLVFLNLKNETEILILSIVCVIASIIIGLVLITHPLISLLEKKGLGVIGIDSSGVLKFYLGKVKLPIISIIKNKITVNTIFDRKLTIPVKVETGEMEIKEDEENLIITIPKKEYCKYNFGFEGWNFLLYNEKTKTLISKEFISNAEDRLIADHEIFYISQKIDDLANNFRDFGRYIVEQLRKPLGIFSGRNILFFLFIICIVVVAIIFAPKIIDSVARMNTPSLPQVPIQPIR